jgi:probable HAF family extracellular repeat protein
VINDDADEGENNKAAYWLIRSSIAEATSVTLNVTILSPVGIHQSADFKISATQKDAAGNLITLQENAAKIVSMLYQDWSGLLTYCGVGLWHGKRTDEFVTEWLTNAPRTATFHEALKIIREQGSRWIGEINEAFQARWPHSFVLAGFEGGVARYAIISNYQSLAGDIRPVTGTLQVDAGSTRDVHVVITGIRDAFSDEDRRLLRRLAETERNFAVIRHHLAEANARAADSPAAKNGLSRACLTASCDPTGAQRSQLYGDVPGPVAPRGIFGGVDLGKLLEQFLRENPNAKVVQSASVSTSSHRAVVEERIECNLCIRSGFDDAQREAMATVEEKGTINEYCLDTKAINEGGCIVGNVRVLPDANPHAFFWRPSGAIQDLGTLGGPHGYANDVNVLNEVVGGAHVNSTDMHAFVWTEEGGLLDLGTLGGQNSSALCINDRSQIVGQSRGKEGTQERAFVYSRQTGIVELFPSWAGWSRAIAVTNEGVIVGWAGCGARTDFGFVLYPGERNPLEIRTASGCPFFISAVSDSGLVVGEADDPSGHRRPSTWTRERGLMQLATDEPFHPMDVDRYGNIVGYVQGGRHPLILPYIWTAEGELLPLPYAEEHATDAIAVNGRGQIVGAARGATWKHVHPLVWQLR